MKPAIKNNLAQLAQAERYIAQFQKLSNIHEHTLTEHNDQLDFSWKDGYEKGIRDANATHNAVKQTAAEVESDKIQQLRLQLATRESELDDLTLKIADQAKRHQKRVDELKAELAQKPKPIVAELGLSMNTGFVVGNWRDSWKWISNWCFGLIAFFATTPIPPELLAILPENVRMHLIAWVAFCGLIGRYINQSKPLPLPALNHDEGKNV